MRPGIISLLRLGLLSPKTRFIIFPLPVAIGNAALAESMFAARDSYTY